MPVPKVKRALISVYDKTGIVDFARALVEEFDIEIISTGGTAALLQQEGVPVTLVEQLTGFGAMLDGRVKTLHPAIHAGILADRDNPDHMQQLEQAGIKPIDMVVVNLYPFEETIAKPDCTFEQAIEMIDIGGPAMLRAAAKNHKHVIPVCSLDDYSEVLAHLRENRLRDVRHHRLLAARAFTATTRYDHGVRDYLLSIDESLNTEVNSRWPIHWKPDLRRRALARYGENPHQGGAVYQNQIELTEHLLQPAELDETASINNYLDADAALQLCSDLTRAAPNEPRALARAEQPGAKKRPQRNNTVQAGFNPPDPDAACWLLTWTTYGTWLPGDERGFVSRVPNQKDGHTIHNTVDTPYDADMGDVKSEATKRMAGRAVHLTQEQADAVLECFVTVATRHQVNLICASIMPDHVHILCQAAERDGSELLQAFKGAASFELNRRFKLKDSPRWWTKSGSKRFIHARHSPSAAIEYVVSQQNPLRVGVFEGWVDESAVHGSGEAARAKARGSQGASIRDLSDAFEHQPSTNLEQYACVIIKHNNPCGCGVASDPVEAYRRAYLSDPAAAMGGILACNFDVTVEFADAVMNSLGRWGKQAGSNAFFIEVWLAPSFDRRAVEFIRYCKKWGERVRLVSTPIGVPIESQQSDARFNPNALDIRSITGGVLLQTRDTKGVEPGEWRMATKRRPTDREWCDLKLAWLCAKHAKSNAISLVRHGQLIASGAGQTSRVVSCELAVHLARRNGHLIDDGGDQSHFVAASDGFFPFRDGPDILMDAGATAIIQPGGSKRDNDTISACNERGVACVLTGTRHFRH